MVTSLSSIFRPTFLLPGFALLAASHNLFGQTIFDDWRIRHPNPPSNPINVAIYAEGKYVAAGLHATVVTSATGTVWETQFLEPDFEAEGLVYAEDKYVMVDRKGAVATSPDLKAWHIQTIGASSLEDVIHVNDVFVAVGRISKVFVSDDGESWAQYAVSESSKHLEGIAYGNGYYVAIARGGATYRSTDLVDWTETFAGFEGTENMTSNWEGMAFFNGKFIAYGPYERFLVSSNGEDWTDVPNPYDSLFQNHAQWKGELWISGSSDAIIHTSDGDNWTRVSTGIDVNVGGIAASAERIVGFDKGGGVIGSDDGVTWTQLVVGGEEELSSVAEMDGRYVAVSGSDRLLYSEDGVNWTEVLDMSETTVNYNPGIGVVGNRFVAVGGRGEIAWSEDGQTWNTDTVVDFTAIVRELSVANGILFAGCDSGIVAYSTNGLDWTEADTGAGSGYGYRIERVSYFNDTYFAAGGTGTLAMATDIDEWTLIPLDGTTAPMEILLYYNNQYILFPVSGSRLLFSEDLATWTSDRTDPIIRAGGAWIYDGQIIVAGNTGTIFTSDDGDAFVEHALPVGSFREILYDGEQYLAVGVAGIVATTGNDPLSILNLTVEGTGTVSRSPNQALYDASSLVRLTANPSAGQQFLWWETGDGVHYGNTLDLALSTDTNVTAIFAGLEAPAVNFERDGSSARLGWHWDPAWILHRSTNLTDWSAAPGVSSAEDRGNLENPEPTTGSHFYQFRLRTP